MTRPAQQQPTCAHDRGSSLSCVHASAGPSRFRARLWPASWVPAMPAATTFPTMVPAAPADTAAASRTATAAARSAALRSGAAVAGALAGRVPLDPRHGAVQSEPRPQVTSQMGGEIRQRSVQDEVRVAYASDSRSGPGTATLHGGSHAVIHERSQQTRWRRRIKCARSTSRTGFSAADA